MNGSSRARMEALATAWEAFSSLPLAVRVLAFAVLAGLVVWLIWWNVQQDHKPRDARTPHDRG